MQVFKKEKPLTIAKDQKVILISSLTPGSYLVQVQNKYKTLLGAKLIKQ